MNRVINNEYWIQEDEDGDLIVYGDVSTGYLRFETKEEVDIFIEALVNMRNILFPHKLEKGEKK